MNTPTPRTDALVQPSYGIKEINMLIFHARQLEQELNEVINRGDSYGQKYAACMLERDQLRKVADKLAFQLAVTHRETGCLSQCPVIATLDSYNQLPHVKERNEK